MISVFRWRWLSKGWVIWSSAAWLRPHWLCCPTASDWHRNWMLPISILFPLRNFQQWPSGRLVPCLMRSSSSPQWKEFSSLDFFSLWCVWLRGHINRWRWKSIMFNLYVALWSVCFINVYVWGHHLVKTLISLMLYYVHFCN